MAFYLPNLPLQNFPAYDSINLTAKVLIDFDKICSFISIFA